DFVRIANDFDWEIRFRREHFGFAPQGFVFSGEKDCLHVKFATYQLAKDLWNVTAAFPAGIQKDCKLLGLKAERPARCLGGLFAGKIELGMDRHSRNLYSLGRYSIVD